MIILIYLFSRKFKYIIKERFVSETIITCNEPSSPINIDLINIGYEIDEITINPNIFFKLTYTPETFTNKIRLLYNQTTLTGEVYPEVYVYLGKSFLGNSLLKTDNTFLNIWNNYSDLSKKHLIYSNVEDFTHYYRISLNQYTNTSYNINRSLFETLPNQILFNLTLINGSGFDGIEIKPAIFMIELIKLENYEYLPQNLYILNGGSGYKTLPTSITLNTDYYRSSTYEINFTTLILDKINRYNSYHIIKKEIINKGLYFNEITYHRINNLIPYSNLPNFTISLNNNSITNFKNIYQKLYTEIDYIKCIINKIKIKATNILLSSSSSRYIDDINFSYRNVSKYLEDISNNYNDIINCIIPKLSGGQPVAIDSSVFCKNGNIITINNFQKDLLLNTATLFDSLKNSVLNETDLLIEKYKNIKSSLLRYGINNSTLNSIISSNEDIKNEIFAINYITDFIQNINSNKEKRAIIIKKGDLIYNNFINIGTDIIPTYLLTDNRNINQNLYNDKINKIKEIYNNINNELKNGVLQIYNNESITDINKNTYYTEFNNNLANMLIIYNKAICIGNTNLGIIIDTTLSTCGEYINLNTDNIQSLLDDILRLEIIAYRYAILIYLLLNNKLLNKLNKGELLIPNLIVVLNKIDLIKEEKP